MRKSVVLVTGANGEIGHALVRNLSRSQEFGIVSLDIQSADEQIGCHALECIQGSILDKVLLEQISRSYDVHAIYHLAALLSTSAEHDPLLAHKVNVEGTLLLLNMALEHSRRLAKSVLFVFPSSIAAYGLPDLTVKGTSGAISETEWNQPITIYGCNKLYCEHLGRYFARHYRQLAASQEKFSVDFRAIRFPGLISALTLPTGGTSDYAPEMIHAAAQNKRYACFVREDTIIPFMAMPDAIKAIDMLAMTPRVNLTNLIYNINSFSVSASQLASLVQTTFPQAEISFSPDSKRQGIVDSWPAMIDDSAARRDWGWQPDYDLHRTFSEYLVPGVLQRYGKPDDENER